MTTRENLFPQRITDVNGKVTTVYRKRLSTASEFTPLFPPVVAALRVTRLDALAARVAETVGCEGDENELRFLRNVLGRYSNELNSQLECVLDGSDANFATSVSGLVNSGESEEVVRDCIAFAPRLGMTDFGEAFTLVKGLKHYHRFSAHPDLSRAPKEVQNDCVSLMTLTRLLVEQDSGTSSALMYYYNTDSSHPSIPIIANEELIVLALESEETFQKVQNIVKEYSTSDPKVIRGIIQGVEPSLASGAL